MPTGVKMINIEIMETKIRSNGVFESVVLSSKPLKPSSLYCATIKTWKTEEVIELIGICNELTTTSSREKFEEAQRKVNEVWSLWG